MVPTSSGPVNNFELEFELEILILVLKNNSKSADDDNKTNDWLSNFEEFFGGTEFENGFEKSKDLTTNLLKAFLSNTPQSIKRQSKGQKEHDEKYIPSCGLK